MKKLTVSLAAFAMLFTIACKKTVDNNTVSPNTNVYLDLPDTTTNYFGNTSTLEHMNNMAQLGRVLFYDKHLSINNATSCASCHKQQFAFSDNTQFSRGFENRLTGRNSMAIQNFGQMQLRFTSTPTGGRYVPRFQNSTNLFWDGREQNIKNLIARPITNHVEMGVTDMEELANKLQAISYYNDLFTQTYGDAQVTVDRMSECIATFMHAITANNTRLDQATKNQIQFTSMEAFGQKLFTQKYNCASCHITTPGGYNPVLSNFANIGLDAQPNDIGAGTINGPQMNGKFKAPNLRNVAVTGPYMHDGRFATLEDVIKHYSEGIEDSPNLDERLKDWEGKPMKMNIPEEEQKALVAFLRTMTDYKMLTEPKYSNPFKTR